MSRRCSVILDSSENEDELDIDFTPAVRESHPRKPSPLAASTGPVLKPASTYNRFAHAGAASLVNIKEYSEEDRVSCYTFLDEAKLLNVQGTPRELYTRTLWQNRLEEFMDTTATKTKTMTPDAKDLQAFLVCMTLRARPTPDRVPSYMWLEHARQTVIKICKFKFKDFALSDHEEAHMNNVMAQLLVAGNVTKDPIRAKQWIGSTIVRQLVTGLVMQAHKAGTLSWDVTIAKWLSIVLVSALGCRVGDVMMSQFDEHELPFLAYQDVKLTLKDDGSDLSDLVAVITIRNEKGHKYDPDNNRIVLLKSLTSPQHSLMDPIMLLLITALRYGEVFETSIEQLLGTLRTHRRVIWKNPQNPVLCKFEVSGRAVEIGQATCTQQLSRTLQEAVVTSGISTPLAPHDLRRGAARDVAHSSGYARGLANSSVQAAIGHAQNANNLEVTSKYVGQAAIDRYTARVEEPFVDPIYNVSANRDVANRQPDGKARPTEVTQFCEANGLSVDDPRSRKKASALMAKRRLEDWTDATKKRPHLERTAEGDQNLDECLVDAVQGQSLESLTAGPSETGVLPFSTDHLSFVKEYSRINVSKNYTLGTTRSTGDEERSTLSKKINGNSRDEASQFEFACKNAHFGCPHITTIFPELHRHETLCRYTSIDAAAEIAAKDAKKTLPCDQCDRTFATDEALFDHRRKVHNWKSRSCDSSGCDNSVVYSTDYEWKKHLDTHCAFPPTHCRYPQCSSKNVFQKANTYRQHLRRSHDVKGTAADVFLPDEYKSIRGQRA